MAMFKNQRVYIYIGSPCLLIHQPFLCQMIPQVAMSRLSRDSPQAGSAGVALVRSDGLPVGKIAGTTVSFTDQKWGPPMTGNGKHTTYLWWFIVVLSQFIVLYHLLVIREMGSCCSLRRGVHAQTHCWMCILYCFLQCFLLLDNAALGGGGGGAGTTVSSSDVFCLCPFALVFTVFFALSHFFLCTICIFHWFLQCFQASWRYWCYAAHWGGVGWDGAITFMWGWSRCWGFIMLLMLKRGMLTFHVTCSRCWCYAMLGWGGILTFHVTCSRCWCYATLGWGGC